MVVSTSVLGVEMFSKLKKLTYRVLLIGNIIVVLLMLLVGNIGRLNPVDYPSLANLGLGFPIFACVQSRVSWRLVLLSIAFYLVAVVRLYSLLWPYPNVFTL